MSVARLPAAWRRFPAGTTFAADPSDDAADDVALEDRAMRPEFYEIYRDLYEEYPDGADRSADPSRDRRERTIRMAVERGIAKAEATSAPGARIRPDARHFLLVNFSEMVARPVARARRGGDLDVPNDRQLADLVEEDVATIVRAAEGDARVALGARPPRAGEVEVEGGDVVRALARVYGELRTVTLNVWG